MTKFEVMYLVFGTFITSAGVVMVLTYTLTNPWWKTHIGRMMITYAVAEILMSALLMATVVWHVSPEWFRGVWFVLQTVVGCTFWFQTYVIVRLHQQRTEKGASP
jgi:hypothetical protein